MSATLLFFAVLLGFVILFTAIITLCAISISSSASEDAHRSTSNQNLHLKEFSDRRRVCRSDFPFICNDGSYAWNDRRKAGT